MHSEVVSRFVKTLKMGVVPPILISPTYIVEPGNVANPSPPAWLVLFVDAAKTPFDFLSGPIKYVA
jgi:hypothetical protein